MIRNVALTLVPLILFLILSFSIKRSVPDNLAYRDKFQTNDRLVVAIDKYIPGYFTSNDESYGIHCEILKNYADLLDIKLEIVSDNSISMYPSLLQDKKINMAVVSDELSIGDNKAVPIINTKYVVMARKEKNNQVLNNIYELCDVGNDKTLMISQSFTSSGSYDILLDSLKNMDTYLTSKNNYDILKELSIGKYDFVICEKTGADAVKTLIKNITSIYEFEDEVPVYVLFHSDEAYIADHFRTWLNAFRQSTKYADIYNAYKKYEIVDKITNQLTNTKSGGVISKYDNIIQDIARKENMDWRLISAIAYQESKFNPHVVSVKGARGLMQVMPKVAEQFDCSPDSLLDIQTNITVAIKLLKNIERSIKFAQNTEYNDKLGIILACYNCGIGHVLDARRLAVKFEEDPDKWINIKKYLELKSLDEIVAEDVVKSGKFHGIKETSSFVNNVITKYESYCLIATL